MQLPPNMPHERTAQPRALRKLCNDMTAFVHRAEDAATSLYAISYYCCSLFGSGPMQRDVAGRLTSVAGAVTFLHGFLGDDKHASPLLSPRDMETIADNMRACESVMQTVTSAMQKLDEYLMSGEYEKGMSVPAKFNAFNKDGEADAVRVLTRCCDVVIKATMIARREELGRREDL